MYYLKKKGTWFGMLESSRGDAVMIWDSLFPTASTGKVFLYNAKKDAVIEYVEELVRPKLRDLDKQELKQVRLEYGDRWADVRSQYEPEEEEQQKNEKPVVNVDALDIDTEVDEGDISTDIPIDEDFEDI